MTSHPVPRQRKDNESLGEDPAIRLVADEFGVLTERSSERLGRDGEDFGLAAVRRREQLERIAGNQVLHLFEAMEGLLSAEDRQSEELCDVLARSSGVGVGFALLPSRKNAKPDALNEESALEAIDRDPAAWLEFEESERRFRYTSEALVQLRESYVSGGGCPLVNLEIEGVDGADAFNLFVAYWGLLASEHRPRNHAA